MKKTRESPAFKDAKIATLEEIIEMLKYEVKELKNEIAKAQKARDAVMKIPSKEEYEKQSEKAPV